MSGHVFRRPFDYRESAAEVSEFVYWDAILDPVRNFIEVPVTGYDSLADTILVGAYAQFPDTDTEGAFNLIWWNATDYVSPHLDPDKEIVRVTTRVANEFHIIRGQEGTVAVDHNTAGKVYHLMISPTKKMIDDIRNLFVNHNHSSVYSPIGHPHSEYPLRSEWLQNGFVDKSDLTISFNDATRTITIAPSGVSFDYFYQGIRYTKNSPQTLAISDDEGIHAIYFVAGTLTEQLTPTHAQLETIIEDYAWVADVYWDDTNNVGKLFDERHGCFMSPATHRYLHDTFGTQYESGLAIGDILADQSGDLDTHAQFSVASGIVYDEDLEIETNDIASNVGLEIWYNTAAGWRRTTNAGFSVLITGTGRLAYNNAGVLAEVSNTNFSLYHVFACNAYDVNPIAIVGQAIYTTLAGARAGATTEIGSLLLAGLPTPEMKPIASIIFQTSNAYGNAVKSRIRTTDTGDDYVDWRSNPISPSFVATDHGSLSGLLDDDHPQYMRLDQTDVQTIIGDAPIFSQGLFVSGGSGLDITNGQTIQVFDAANTKWLNLYHDGTNAYIFATGGNLRIPNNIVYLGDGGSLVIQSSGDDKNLSLSHNDTNGLITSSDGTISFDNENLITTGNISAATAKLSGLTDGYIPYHVSDATGLANSAVQSNASVVGIGVAPDSGIRLFLESLTIAVEGFGTGLYVREPIRAISVDETNYFTTLQADSNAYNIATSKTDSGYRYGLVVAAAAYEPNFKGTLHDQRGIRILHGIISSNASAVIESSYGLYIDSYHTTGTVINLYAIYQASADATNYFAGPMTVVKQLTSILAIGTSPFAVTSTTVNTNLNADLLDGSHAAAFQPIDANLTSLAGLSHAVGDLIYATAATTYGALADVAAGSYLRSGGVTTAPLWSTLILPNAATAYRLPVATGANTIGELAAVGATGEYLAGATGAIPAWATLNQAAVAGLTTGSSPAFVTVKCSGLADGYLPYHVADATGLSDSHLHMVTGNIHAKNTSANSRTVFRIMPNGTEANIPAALEFFGTDFEADDTNYERLVIYAKGSGNSYYTFKTDKGGSGTLRSLQITTGANTGIILDTSANVGIGMAPSSGSYLETPGLTSNSSAKFGSFEIQSYAVNNAWLSENCYYGAGFTYRANGYAALAYFENGQFQIRTGPSGTAGNTFTPSQVFTILNGGNVGIGIVSPTSTLHNAGSFSCPTVAVSANYVVLATDFSIFVTGGASDRDITLPVASGCSGRIYIVKKVDNGVGKAHVIVAGGGTIDGGSYYDVAAIGAATIFQSDGSEYKIIANTQ